MPQQTVRSGVGRTTADYIVWAAYALYTLATLSFLAGLYIDLTRPDAIIIPLFSIANEPSNSGLFVLAILLLVVGLLVGKLGNAVAERQVENIDQTQEWTVDVGSDRS